MAEGITKKWGQRDFWGVGFDYDHQWFLTESQKELQTKLIELCRTTIRPNAIISDETYEYPRANMGALAELGILALFAPRELGGLGESHECAAMVCETVARYGCPSTAMVLVMHLAAVATICFRHHGNKHIEDLIRRINKDKLIGTLSYSDPATGGHFWHSLSSKCWQLDDDRFKVLKYASWTTSAGFADWYVIQTISPKFDGDFSNSTNFLCYSDEVRGSTDEWLALGLHGNQSGPMVAEGVLKKERMIGPIGDGPTSNDETVDVFFMLLSSSVWNGIALGSIDLAKRHVVSKTHGDTGIRVCDYPTIKDYFGESMSETNAARCLCSALAIALDKATNGCDWSLHADPKVIIRVRYLHWSWQSKFVSAKNVGKVVDTMLHACGGSGYKLDLGLERLLRDAKAGWVMGPSNEVTRMWVGQSVLLGLESVDFWNQGSDQRILRSELRKMTRDEKRELAKNLMYEADLDEGEDTDTFDFDNPLSAKLPSLADGGPQHKSAMKPDKWAETSLCAITYLTKDEKYALFSFDYADKTMHSGCYSGQYIEMAIPGSTTNRYISPVSEPIQYGKLEAVIRYEAQGVLANYLKTLKIGDKVSFRGPCGGLEYSPNLYSHIVFLCGGIGVTPAIQIVRSIVNNPRDTTRVTVFYQAKKLDELLFRDELDGYQKKHERFNIVYTLQDIDDAWGGNDGFIDYNFLSKHTPKATKDGSLKVVICGGGAMATVCLNALSLLKFRSQDIFIYGPFAAEQLRSVFGRNIKLFAK